MKKDLGTSALLLLREGIILYCSPKNEHFWGKITTTLKKKPDPFQK